MDKLKNIQDEFNCLYERGGGGSALSHSIFNDHAIAINCLRILAICELGEYFSGLADTTLTNFNKALFFGGMND